MLEVSVLEAYPELDVVLLNPIRGGCEAAFVRLP